MFLTEILRSTRKHVLAMVDPDAPSKKKSSKAQWLHWIVTNVEGRKVNNPVGWIVFVFHSFQPTPFLLGLVLSIGTSGSTEVGDHYWSFILRSPTSSFLRYHLIIRPEIIQQWAYTRCSWDIVCRLRMGMKWWCTQAPHHQKGEELGDSCIFFCVNSCILYTIWKGGWYTVQINWDISLKGLQDITILARFSIITFF